MVLAEGWQLLRVRRISLGRTGGGNRRGVGGRRGAVRRRSHGLGSRCVWHGGHSAVGIQQMVLARAQAELDQRPRVRHSLALPTVIGLIAAHGLFAGLIPGTRGFSAQVMLADQRFLNRMSPLGVDFLLAAHSR